GSPATLSVTGTIASGSNAAIKITAAADRAGNAAAQTSGTVDNTDAIVKWDATAPVISDPVLVDGTVTGVAGYSTGKVVWRFRFAETGSGINALTLSNDVFAGTGIKYRSSDNPNEYDTTVYTYLTGSYDSGAQKITFGTDWLTGQYLYIAGMLKDTADADATTLSLAAFTDGAGNAATNISGASANVTIDKTGPTGSGGNTPPASGDITLTFTDNNTPVGVASVALQSGTGSIGSLSGSSVTLSSATLPGDGVSASWTFTAEDGLGNSRDCVYTITNNSGTYAGTWDNSGSTTPPSPTLSMAAPFTAPLSAPPAGFSAGPGRINSYYSMLVNSNAGRGGAGGRIPVLPVSYAGRGVRVPVQTRTRIAYAYTGAERRELYRDLETASRSNAVPLRELVRADDAAEDRNPAALNVERNFDNRRNPGDGRSEGTEGPEPRKDAVTADTNNGGNQGSAAAAPLVAVSFLEIMEPLTGDSGEGVPPQDHGGRNGAGERSFLDPHLKPWTHARKARARRRPNY
ncbi:MAG: hypothetical protein LBP23_08730, partial [Treponema sp.]|nr:hypothetical protein [Treponema sp.]